LICAGTTWYGVPAHLLFEVVRRIGSFRCHNGGTQNVKITKLLRIGCDSQAQSAPKLVLGRSSALEELTTL